VDIGAFRASPTRQSRGADSYRTSASGQKKAPSIARGVGTATITITTGGVRYGDDLMSALGQKRTFDRLFDHLVEGRKHRGRQG
jgi:hypothetical protein